MNTKPKNKEDINREMFQLLMERHRIDMEIYGLQQAQQQFVRRFEQLAVELKAAELSEKKPRGRKSK